MPEQFRTKMLNEMTKRLLRKGMREKRIFLSETEATNLRKRINSSGRSQADLARQIGVSRQVISQAIAHKSDRKILPSVLNRIEAALCPSEDGYSRNALGRYQRSDLSFIEGDWLAYRCAYVAQSQCELICHVFRFRWVEKFPRMSFEDITSWASYAGPVSYRRSDDCSGDSGIIGLLNHVDGIIRLTNLVSPNGERNKEVLYGGTLTSRPINSSFVVATGAIVLYKQKRFLAQSKIKEAISNNKPINYDEILSDLSRVLRHTRSAGWRI